jgi:hypothetical protein
VTQNALGERPGIAKKRTAVCSLSPLRRHRDRVDDGDVGGSAQRAKSPWRSTIWRSTSTVNARSRRVLTDSLPAGPPTVQAGLGVSHAAGWRTPDALNEDFRTVPQCRANSISAVGHGLAAAQAGRDGCSTASELTKKTPPGRGPHYDAVGTQGRTSSRPACKHVFGLLELGVKEDALIDRSAYRRPDRSTTQSLFPGLATTLGPCVWSDPAGRISARGIRSQCVPGSTPAQPRWHDLHSAGETDGRSPAGHAVGRGRGSRCSRHATLLEGSALGTPARIRRPWAVRPAWLTDLINAAHAELRGICGARYQAPGCAALKDRCRRLVGSKSRVCTQNPDHSDRMTLGIWARLRPPGRAQQQWSFF